MAKNGFGVGARVAARRAALDSAQQKQNEQDDRHQAEAARPGLPVQVVTDQILSWDVDIPADLDLPDGEDLALGLRR